MRHSYPPDESIVPLLLHCNKNIAAHNTASPFWGCGVLGCCTGALAQFLGLLGQYLHLTADKLSLQPHQLLDVLRPHQLLRELEGARHVALGETHRLFSDMPCPFAGALGLALEGIDGLVGGGNESVESLPSLLDALLGKSPHVVGNFKMIGGSHDVPPAVASNRLLRL